MVRFILALLLSVAPAGYKATIQPLIQPEHTFFKICWLGLTDIYEVAYYPPNGVLSASGICNKPEEITWPQATIRIKFAAETTEKTRVATRAALLHWNKILGWELFVETIETYDVIVQQIPKAKGHALASARHFREAGHLAAVIQVYPTGARANVHALATIQLHELGHVLGLHHDIDNPKSLMYPYQGTKQILTKADRNALLDKYPAISLPN